MCIEGACRNTRLTLMDALDMRVCFIVCMLFIRATRNDRGVAGSFTFCVLFLLLFLNRLL